MFNADDLKKKFLNDIETARSESQLSEVWKTYLSKNGSVQGLMNGIKEVAKEEKKAYGQFVNDVKNWVQEKYDEKKKEIETLELQQKYERETIDVTVPVKTRPMGNLHPLTAVKYEMINVFAGMGFEIFEGPEIEDDDHNFTRLNVLKDHPSRDMQDTFYIAENLLLRTQTSAAQIRTMETRKPPIKIICPGRVYRADEVDATHSPVFHQIEGLVVDKGITMCDLKGVLEQFAHEIYGPETEVKFRPSFFPFTEPSVEVDVTCSECRGKGCRVCKGSGWIEILGAGMVHPRVLKSCGIDPEEYSGFAFGIGLDRITTTRYKISDIRLLFENDLRFLSQF